MNDWDTSFDCPICGRDDCVPAYGNKNAEILVIAEFPGDEEVTQGKPLCGNTGTVLKHELGRLGMDLKCMRICNLWIHPPNKNNKCLEYGASKVIEESIGKKAILLLGSDVVKYFCGEDVGSVAGLRLTSNLLFSPLIVASPNPAIVFRSTIGELRLSLQKFESLYRSEYENG